MEHFTISEWLKSIGCDRYTNAFISNNCTTKEAVSSLTAQQLQQWGVDRSEDDYGRRILKATRSLLQQSEEEATQEYLNRLLYKASFDGNADKVKELIARGGKVNWHHPGENGNSTLHVAAALNHSETLNLLINKEANINATNKVENTPLHRAAYNGHLQIAKLLYERGADLSLRNRDGMTPLECAKNSFGSGKVAEYLEGIENNPQEKLSSSSLQSSAQQLTADIAREKELIQRHIQEQGSLNVKTAKILLCGLPCSGKTTGMRRLSNQLCRLNPKDSPISSTGFEKPQTVELYHKTEKQSVMIAGVGSEAVWLYQDLEQQGQSLYSLILESQYKSSHTSTSSVSSSSHPKTQPSLKLSKGSVSSQSFHSLEEQQAILTSLVKSQDWSAVRDKLKGIEDFTTLHMIDCGGHPECHDILPLLFEGQALNLVFFNLTHDLDKMYNVVFRGKEGLSEVQYQSMFTTREVLQRILCSISSLHCGPHKEKPAALLVGSHLDQINNMDSVFDLDKSIQEAFKSFIEDDVLIPANSDKEQYIATLNNMSEDQSDIEELRKVILNIMETRFTHESMPTSWLLLHLLLRHKFEADPGWCSLKDCVTMAMTCGIKEEELIGEEGILSYIHKHYGTLLYYPKVAGLENIVICDPNIILQPITKTFIFSFACNPGHIQTAKFIRATAEISHNFMDCVCASDSSRPIPTSAIVALLKDRYIIYEDVRNDKGNKCYIMPCLLQPDPSVIQEAKDPTALSKLNPAPLLLIPEGYVPLGLFPALVVEMSKLWLLKSSSLKQPSRFSNKVPFKITRRGKQTRNIELRQHPNSLELRLLPSALASGEQNNHLLVSCRDQLWQAVGKVSSQYPHMRDVVWSLGFYCPTSLHPGEQPHYAKCLQSNPVDITCCNDPVCEQEEFPLEHQHRVWFNASSVTTGADNGCTHIYVPTVPHLSLGAPPSLRELLRAVKEVSDWKQIGTQLNITRHELEEIEVSEHGVANKKTAMFSVWLRSHPCAAWGDLVTALELMGEETVASQVHRKYMSSDTSGN